MKMAAYLERPLISLAKFKIHEPQVRVSWCRIGLKCSYSIPIYIMIKNLYFTSNDTK